MSAVAEKRYTTADSIQVLEGLEPVRKRPSMYIGGTDSKGLHHLIWEIVDNSVDEYLNQEGDCITVTLHKSGDAISVADNGRGIPVDFDKKYKKSGLELVLTVLHAGGKFGETDSYIYSGGLHGVGASVVNALSRKMVATVRRDGYEWQQTYAKGVPTSKLEKVGPFRGHGTIIYFEPDPTIFKTTKFDAKEICSHLEDMSYIHSGLKIIFKNDVTGETHDLTHAGGIPEYLQRLVTEGGEPGITEMAFTLARGNGDKMEVALHWTNSTDEVIRSYVNGIRTASGGTHETGFKSAVVKAVRNYMETQEVKTKWFTIAAEDIREGIVGIVSVFVREPMFQGQTKERLNNPEMTAVVEGFVRPALETWLNGNTSAADHIVGRIVMAAQARQASRDAVSEVKRKTVGSRRLNLPGKLTDCKSTDLDESELFIVEGDSAGGSAIQGRENRTQAVLPLRGKILNAEGISTAKALANQELNDLVSAIGTGAGDKFRIEGLRYGKIILLMDADADGHHISTLLLDFFFRHMTDLIRKGHVYIAQPPLYRLDVGKERHWAMDDRHKEEIVARLGARKYEITRFKGLGEMDAKEIRETTLDRNNRVLLKVEIDNPLKAHEIFDHLLGKDPIHRYNEIVNNAEMVAADDIDV